MTALRKYKLSLAYDGTHYKGWQKQNTGVAIQHHVDNALSTILREPIFTIAAGRTDAGVHALAQVAHFSASCPIDSRRVLFSLNSLLPSDIRATALDPVPPTFHARYSATGKIYFYHLHLGPVMDPFKRPYRTHVPLPFDLEKLKSSIKLFIGKHDFTSFTHEAHRGTAATNAVRHLRRLDIVSEIGGLRLEFEADGFLYKMVRNITGTLLEIARGKTDLESIPKIFAAKDRRMAGPTAPPQGLFLAQVLYAAY